MLRRIIWVVVRTRPPLRATKLEGAVIFTVTLSTDVTTRWCQSHRFNGTACRGVIAADLMHDTDLRQDSLGSLALLLSLSKDERIICGLRRRVSAWGECIPTLGPGHTRRGRS